MSDNWSNNIRDSVETNVDIELLKKEIDDSEITETGVKEPGQFDLF